MARRRITAAQRKIAEARARAALANAPRPVADQIADGVRSVAHTIAPHTLRGALYWLAPMQYVVEQMGPKVCKAHELPPERADDVAAYLLAGLNEYVTALVGEFDVEHFERWTAAAVANERAESIGE